MRWGCSLFSQISIGYNCSDHAYVESMLLRAQTVNKGCSHVFTHGMLILDAHRLIANCRKHTITATRGSTNPGKPKRSHTVVAYALWGKGGPDFWFGKRSVLLSRALAVKAPHGPHVAQIDLLTQSDHGRSIRHCLLIHHIHATSNKLGTHSTPLFTI